MLHLFLKDVPTCGDEDEADEYVEHADGEACLQDKGINKSAFLKHAEPIWALPS